ncbi:hypothetical protein Tco_0770989 [Tanacetum coccineum]|uniref:Secreted protein n=1 Tax=Tanacetum coccineum TaxID=301880 RepID=A0ABQ4ZHI3_9ASTR
MPSSIPKVHFLGFSFMFISLRVLNVSLMSLIISCSVRLLITRSSTYTSKFLPICFWKALSTKRCAWLLFFYLTGGHPSRTFSRCSAICPETPIMSTGFQANMSRLRLMMVEGYASGPETIVHSSGIILLLRSVSIPPGTRNFKIP